MKTDVPAEINGNVKRLLDLMQVEFDPEMVRLIPESYAQPVSCYYNVAEKIKIDGGKIHYGWAIWESHILVEAEHHAVWENQNGNFLDITPRPEIYHEIMFVSDNSKIFLGQSFDNIRINISGNPIIDDLILILATKEKLFSLGNRTDSMTVLLPPEIAEKIKSLEVARHNTLAFYQNGGKLGSHCFCGSFKKYRDCHGHDLKIAFSTLVKNAKVLCQKN